MWQNANCGTIFIYQKYENKDIIITAGEPCDSMRGMRKMMWLFDMIVSELRVLNTEYSPEFKMSSNVIMSI